MMPIMNQSMLAMAAQLVIVNAAIATTRVSLYSYTSSILTTRASASLDT